MGTCIPTTHPRAARSPTRHRRRPALRLRPTLDFLEGRALLSTVTSLLDDGPGTLRAAISAATPGERIDFAPELASGTIALASPLVLSRSLDIDGPDGAPVVLSGGDAHRVLRVDPGVTATLLDLTITQGLVSDDSRGGGGIDNAGTSLTLRRCSVTKNRAITNNANGRAVGGGIFNDGNLVLDACDVTGNTAAYGSWFTIPAQLTGGGIENWGGSVTIIGGSVRDNSVSAGVDPYLTYSVSTIGGGGLHTAGGSVAMSGVTVSGNVVAVWHHEVTVFGGGIANQGGSVTLVDCTVTANQVAEYGFSNSMDSSYNPSSTPTSLGGGIYSAGTLDVRHSEINGNQAYGYRRIEYGYALPGGDAYGGGVYVAGGEARIVGGTIEGNAAIGGAGAGGKRGIRAPNRRSGSPGGVGGSAGGGAVFSVGSTHIDGASIRNNRALGGPGGVGGQGVADLSVIGGGGNGGNGGDAAGGAFAGSPVYAVNLTLANNIATAGAGGLGGLAGYGAPSSSDGAPGRAGQAYPDTTPMAALTVAPVVVNAGAAQRSNLATTSFQFDLPTNLAARIADGSIVNVVTLYGPDGRITLPASRYRYDEATKTLAIDLAGPDGRTILPDGRYQLRIATAQVAAAGDPNNTLIDTDTTFDGLTVSSFHRLQGDYDGDGTVAVADRVDLMAHFGAAPGTALYDVAYDLNGDGVVNLADYLIWTRRLGRKV